MPIPDKDLLIGATVTEQGFKNAMGGMIDTLKLRDNQSAVYDSEAVLKASKLEQLKLKAKALDTGKIYEWNRTSAPGVTSITGSWIDTGLSEFEQAKEYAIQAVAGINIFDKSKVEIGKYYDRETGEKADAENIYGAIKLIIEPNTVYQFTPGQVQQFAILDEKSNYLEGFLRPNSERKFTSHVRAKYIGLTVEIPQLDTLMLCKASEFPAIYTPFYINNKNLSINSNQVMGLMTEVKNELGVVAVNLIDKLDVIQNKYVDYTTGSLETNNSFVASNLIEIKPSTIYQFSDFYDQQGAYYDVKGIYISGFASPNAEHKITTPSNAKYIRVSIHKTQIDTLVLAESELFPDSYVPFGSKIIQGLMVDTDSTTQVTEIITSADTGDTSADFTGKNAIQLALDSITDATDKNRYRIIAKGVFKVDKASDYIGYRGYPAMILAKDNVEIVGDGNTVVSAELPYNDADIGLSVDGGNYPRIRYQTLYTYAENALIKGIRFIAKNIRYAIHIDNPNGANKRHDFKDVSFIFKGDKGSQQALGCGTSTGEETYFDGGECHSDVGMPLYCHNNSKFVKPSLMSFKDYSFSSNVGKYALNLQNDGSLVKDRVEMIGCSFGGSAYVILYDEAWLQKNTAQKYDSFDHAEWTFTGYGNDPFLFENNVGGLSLRFKTTGAGTDKTIRFDKTASAYALLIQNNQANTDVSLYLDNRDYIDGYIVQDGSVGLPAQALGCKDVSEVAGLYDSGVIYTSLGKRLGNCSGVNKILKVIINGATNTITFNKDYTAMTNSAILTEINAALSGATADLYSYGRDYYPMMSDVAETVYNSGAAYIPKGSVVTKSGGTVRLANGNDKVFGVALDDIPVMQTTADGARKGCGRVLKRGYIYANPAKAHFVLADSQTPSIGTRFSVNNGRLVTNTNGKISVDIDTGVVSINC